MARNRRPGDLVFLQANDSINYDGNNLANITFDTPNDEVILIIGARYHPGAATYGGMLNLVRSITQIGTISLNRIFRDPAGSDGVPLPMLAASSQRASYTGQRGFGNDVFWHGDAREMERLIRALARASARVMTPGQINTDPDDLAYRIAESVQGVAGTLGVAGFVAGGYSGASIQIQLADLSAGSDEIGRLELVAVSLGYDVPVSGSDGQHNAPFWIAQPATAFTDAYTRLDIKTTLTLTGSQMEKLIFLASGALVHDGMTINSTTLDLITLAKRNGQTGADFTFNGLSSVAAFSGGVGAALPRLFRDDLFNGENIGFSGEKAAGSGSGTLRLVQQCIGWKPSWLDTFR